MNFVGLDMAILVSSFGCKFYLGREFGRNLSNGLGFGIFRVGVLIRSFELKDKVFSQAQWHTAKMIFRILEFFGLG